MRPGEGEQFDVVVVGAGVVGCAVARRFALAGERVLVIEKGADLLSGASKANSAILHTGFDAPSGSLELACMKAGYEEYLEIAPRMNLPVLETGALVAAWSDEELARLDGIVEQAHANGVSDVQRIERAAMLEREPGLSPAVRGGVLVPREHVIDPWSAPLAYLTQAVEHGARALFGTELTGARRNGENWELETSQGRWQAAFVVNCAGLFGDHVERALLGSSEFTILPRKGQFVVFDKASSRCMRSILLPVPTERTKGIVITRTAFGNLLVGPTAEEQDDRTRASVDRDTLAQLVASAVERVPALEGMPVTAIYAGLRPATERKEYRIRIDRERGYLAVGGIRSTGLTAALGIAQHVLALYEGGQSRAVVEPRSWPRMPNLAEHRPRDWQLPGDNAIVCHCELVTRREIEAALGSLVPPGDIGGLKRRTRACMGRCQGFYCSARVAELTRTRLAVPLAVGDCHE
ncbi:NAD(P)/FAD-dependent oxidoreductase [Burkholderia cenocepacia]|uniref:NAD(P)/FAD-dependent oxidoreductase n=1 Tax=Burkholderia cenocepacia TaxID=95486 RepID=UPI002864D35B|nr:NAD(P)/FAD-dependent oxidoreductase [Burkholderia cenocepacia]MDR5646538.1 NAD(P)/FAD-dependent oxidoreductase [Burkholderia cenocepacia]